jgi:hypothetical protein
MCENSLGLNFFTCRYKVLYSGRSDIKFELLSEFETKMVNNLEDESIVQMGLTV